MAINIDNTNPTRGKSNIIWGVALLILGVLTIKSIGILLLIVGGALFIIGKIKHWFYNA